MPFPLYDRTIEEMFGLLLKGQENESGRGDWKDESKMLLNLSQMNLDFMIPEVLDLSYPPSYNYH